MQGRKVVECAIRHGAGRSAEQVGLAMAVHPPSCHDSKAETTAWGHVIGYATRIFSQTHSDQDAAF